MSNWEKIEEEGKIFWIHEEYGNILDIGEGKYVAMVPVIARLGPFNSLVDAQYELEHCKVEQSIDEYNLQIRSK